MESNYSITSSFKVIFQCIKLVQKISKEYLAWRPNFINEMAPKLFDIKNAWCTSAQAQSRHARRKTILFVPFEGLINYFKLQKQQPFGFGLMSWFLDLPTIPISFAFSISDPIPIPAINPKKPPNPNPNPNTFSQNFRGAQLPFTPQLSSCPP